MNDQQMKLVQGGVWVALAIAALGYVFQYARSIDQAYPTKTFSVDGTAEIETKPDVAMFAVSVLSEGGTDVVELQTQNSEQMNQIIQFMKDQGVAEKDLKTRAYTITPRYNNPVCQRGICPPASIAGYVVSQSLEVKVRDVAQTGALLSGAVTAGGKSVSDIRFVLDDDTDAKNEAREEAIEKAKEKAKMMARAGGFQVGELVSLYESSGDPFPYGMGGGDGMAENLKATRVAPALEPGVVSSSITVNLTYEIINK